jgi:hypothetical protein
MLCVGGVFLIVAYYVVTQRCTLLLQERKSHLITCPEPSCSHVLDQDSIRALIHNNVKDLQVSAALVASSCLTTATWYGSGFVIIITAIALTYVQQSMKCGCK